MPQPTQPSLIDLSPPPEEEENAEESLKEAVQRAQERWTTVGLAYMRGEASRQQAREAARAYDVAQARMSGNPDIVRAAERAR